MKPLLYLMAIAISILTICDQNAYCTEIGTREAVDVNAKWRVDFFKYKSSIEEILHKFLIQAEQKHPGNAKAINDEFISQIVSKLPGSKVNCFQGKCYGTIVSGNAIVHFGHDLEINKIEDIGDIVKRYEFMPNYSQTNNSNNHRIAIKLSYGVDSAYLLSNAEAIEVVSANIPSINNIAKATANLKNIPVASGKEVSTIIEDIYKSKPQSQNIVEYVENLLLDKQLLRNTIIECSELYKITKYNKPANQSVEAMNRLFSTVLKPLYAIISVMCLYLLLQGLRLVMVKRKKSKLRVE